MAGVQIKSALVPRPISRREMQEWADRRGLSEEETDDLRYLLADMEEEFRAIDAERRARG